MGENACSPFREINCTLPWTQNWRLKFDGTHKCLCAGNWDKIIFWNKWSCIVRRLCVSWEVPALASPPAMSPPGDWKHTWQNDCHSGIINTHGEKLSSSSYVHSLPQLYAMEGWGSPVMLKDAWRLGCVLSLRDPPKGVHYPFMNVWTELHSSS